MKLKLFFLNFIVILTLLSCHNDTEKEADLVTTLNTTLHLINEGLSADMEAKFTDYQIRYILEIYKQNSNGTLGDIVDRIVQKTPDFNISLKSTDTYTFAAWSDFTTQGDELTDSFYDTTDLAHITPIIKKSALNNPLLDAYCSSIKNFTPSGKATIELVLKRPLSLIVVKGNNTPKNIENVSITYPSIYTAYNVIDADVAGTKSEYNKEAKMLDRIDHIWAYDYIFAKPKSKETSVEEGTSIYDITVNLLGSGNDIPLQQFKYNNTPFIPSYRTTLMCTSDSKNEVNISIDANFEVEDVEPTAPFVISSYIRANFFDTGRISAESMNACNDLIYLAAQPYSDGTIYFELPHNDAEFNGGVTHLTSYKDRTGVISFNGTGVMNAGNDLLHTPSVIGVQNSGNFPQFTFGTWINIDNWVANSFVFNKQNQQGNQVSLKLGSKVGEFIFKMGNAELPIVINNLKLNEWNHIALTYHNAKGTSFYLDGEPIIANQTTTIKGRVPYIRAEMKLGELFQGKMDEIFFNSLMLSVGEIRNIKNKGINFSSWNMSKTLAYWKFDIANEMGKDEHSWLTILNQFRAQLNSPNIKVRLGLATGDWKGMCSKESSRITFAKNLKTILDKHQLDGADLDFEWPLNESQFNNYSTTIEKTRAILGYNTTFSVSLHPLYYKISPAAIKVLDYISMQSYGPDPVRFPYEMFTKEAEMAINYGIPKNKLIMGVPFYGSAANKAGTAAYIDFINNNLITSEEQDQVNYNNKIYSFNGQSTIRKKAKYVRENQITGMMSWDLATDVPLNHPKSLLKSMIEELHN